MFRRYRVFLISFWSLVLISIIAVVIFFYCISIGKMGFMPTLKQLENPRNVFATELYFEDGALMGRFFIDGGNRVYADYRDIPKNVVDALIATEDVRFYKHSGIDVKSLFRAAWGVLVDNSSAGGGSTITQQLAKMLFPRETNMTKKKLVIRKFREWVIAVRLEKSYSKEEIIAMYLNKFDFLNLAVGINSAASVYFGVNLNQLKTEQAAMLVGMAKNPALFNPLRRPELTLKRRNVVLNQMMKYKKISKIEYDSLSKLPLAINYRKEDHREGLATYFREYLRFYMNVKKPVKSRYMGNNRQYQADLNLWENDPLFGWCNKNFKSDSTNYDIYTDGLKIITSLDSRMQKYAEDAMIEHLSESVQPMFNNEGIEKFYPPFSDDISVDDLLEIIDNSIIRSDRYRKMLRSGVKKKEIYSSFEKPVKMSVFTWRGMRDTIMTPIDSIMHYKSFFRSSFMAMNPHNGEVKAYVGGPNYNYFMYDMVSMGKRQVGSIIKPILYTLAMQEGLTPDQKVPNIPQVFLLQDGTTWSAKGSNRKKGEMVTLRWGLANSENNISGWVLKQFTPVALANMAKKMGITSYIAPVPSSFLGTAEISLKEMVAAYSIYANKGVYNMPIFVKRIEDRFGNVIAELKTRSREVITDRTAYLMLDLLEGVINSGTGIRMRYKYDFRNPMGGKTGTTQEHSDGWFMGVTPELVGGVWVGAEDRSIHFDNIRNGQGASMALPIWAKFLRKVYDDKTIKISKGKFEKPKNLYTPKSVKEEPKNVKEEEGFVEYDEANEVFQ